MTDQEKIRHLLRELSAERLRAAALFRGANAGWARLLKADLKEDAEVVKKHIQQAGKHWVDNPTKF